MKEKILRDNHFRSMHEMGELKRAQELRVDESSVEMQEQMNCMNDSGEFQEVESNHSGRLSYVPSQPAGIRSPRSVLSCDKRLPLDTWNLSGPQENFCNQCSTFDSSQQHHQGVHHCTTPRETGSVPVHIGTTFDIRVITNTLSRNSSIYDTKCYRCSGAYVHRGTCRKR